MPTLPCGHDAVYLAADGSCEWCARLAWPTCTICGRQMRRVLVGRCDACYSYLKRTGCERPMRRTRQPGPNDRYTCINCGDATDRLIRKRCWACYVHQQRFGVERDPAKRIPYSDYKCKHCGNSLDARAQHGLCRDCYDYWAEHGHKLRPLRHQGQPALCECGQPATHVVKFRQLTAGWTEHVGTLRLCPACYEAFCEDEGIQA